MTTDSTGILAEPSGPQWLLLELVEGLYAVDSAAVREIVPYRPVTRLPGAPTFVRGIMNLRGQLVTVVDLSLRLTGAAAANAEGSTVVVQSGERLLGLLVPDVRDVQPLDLSGPESLAVPKAGRGLVTGMGRLADEVVLLIDVDELVRQTLA